MMAEKARLFKDEEVLTKVLNTWNPQACKKLGRQVKNFSQDVWNKHDTDIVKKGCVAKFLQNKDAKQFLINIKEDIIAEASPYDKKWGIGIDENHINIQSPDKWRGSNLLGEILMEIRKELSITNPEEFTYYCTKCDHAYKRVRIDEWREERCNYCYTHEIKPIY
jgi:hypothetical protein